MNKIFKIITCTVLVLIQVHPIFAQQTTKQDTLKELLRRIDILTEEIEKTKIGDVAKPLYESKLGMGPAASKIYQREKSGVSIAGYGEIVYNNFSSENDNNAASGAKDKIDYLRHITYIGFRFNHWLLFNSEIEYEHAKTGSGAPGEVAVEFGYIEAAITPTFNARAGMVLIPIGIMNELHEPPTFHGALRPETERTIIPATWRANGFGIVGTIKDAFEYKLYLTESLSAAKFSASGIRSGRQNGAKAVAENFAVSGRLSYKGLHGLDLGGSFFLGNTGQGLQDSTGTEIDASLRLFSVHAIFSRHGFEFRGLYANSSIDDVSRLNETLGLQAAKAVGDAQSGYYVTFSYDVLPHLVPTSTHSLSPFFQYEKYDTQASVATGFSRNPSREITNVTFGLTYKPHPNVALKADYINRSNKADTGVDQFNVALNYLF